jgi:hypothetical protein
MDHVKANEILDPAEKFTAWERFQSSALVSPRVEINSCIEADKAAGGFAASVASAYSLSTKTTTISYHSRSPSRIDRIQKRLRILWEDTEGSSMQNSSELAHKK